MQPPAILAKILVVLIFLSIVNAGQLHSYQERIIICMLPLKNADAEQLADVLAPFLSPQGKIAAYSPTNTLIFKDQPSVVQMLIKVIKGTSDLSECQNFQKGECIKNKEQDKDAEKRREGSEIWFDYIFENEEYPY